MRAHMHPTPIGPRDPGMKGVELDLIGAIGYAARIGCRGPWHMPHGRWQGEDPAQVLDPGTVQWMSSFPLFEPWRSMLDTSVDGRIVRGVD